MKPKYDFSNGVRAARQHKVKFDTPSYTVYIKAGEVTNFIYPEQEAALFDTLTQCTGMDEATLRKSLESSDFNHVNFVVSRADRN